MILVVGRKGNGVLLLATCCSYNNCDSNSVLSCALCERAKKVESGSAKAKSRHNKKLRQKWHCVLHYYSSRYCRIATQSVPGVCSLLSQTIELQEKKEFAT